jgi:hypothetical protein
LERRECPYGKGPGQGCLFKQIIEDLVMKPPRGEGAELFSKVPAW